MLCALSLTKGKYSFFIFYCSHVFILIFYFLFARYKAKEEQVRNETIQVLDIARGKDEGYMAPIVPVPSSEWSFVSFLLCSVAMAYKANAGLPKPTMKVPSLIGLPGAAVQTHREYK